MVRSAAIGSFTLTIISARANTSPAVATISAPADLYAASVRPAPVPAPCSTSTLCPRATSTRAAEGTRPTRYSSGLISLGTPTSIGPPRSVRTTERDHSGVPRRVSDADCWSAEAAARQLRQLRVDIGACRGLHNLTQLAGGRP